MVAIQAKCISALDLPKLLQEKQIEREQKFIETKGKCILCEKFPAQLHSKINPMHCEKCNDKTEQLLRSLRGPGFTELKY